MIHHAQNYNIYNKLLPTEKIGWENIFIQISPKYIRYITIIALLAPCKQSMFSAQVPKGFFRGSQMLPFQPEDAVWADSCCSSQKLPLQPKAAVPAGKCRFSRQLPLQPKATIPAESCLSIQRLQNYRKQVIAKQTFQYHPTPTTTTTTSTFCMATKRNLIKIVCIEQSDF